MMRRVFVVVLSSGLLAAPCLAGDGDVRVVVTFKGGADAALVAGHGAEVQATLSKRGAVVATVPAGKLAALRADPSVADVEEDGVAVILGQEDATSAGKGNGGGGGGGKGGGGGSSPPAQARPWGVDTVLSGTSPTARGDGVKVAVVDTGIDLAHSDLAVAGDVNFVKPGSPGKDDNGHGSHVAGTIGALDNTIGVVGVAPKASLYAVKVLDRRGSGWMSDVAAGIDWATDNGLHIVNLSLGSSSNSSVVASACTRAEAAGLLLVAAAGNSGDGTTSTSEWSYPAALSAVVSVGATTSSDGLASFSNTNSDVEVSAPGVSIPSTSKDGGYATLSGTSMACPHAVGLAALLWTGSSTGDSVRTALQASVVDLGPAGRDAGFGHGRVDIAP